MSVGGRSARACCLLVAAALWTGCATHADRLREVRESFYAGHVDRALVTIDQHLARHTSDADVLKLERATLDLAAGRPRQAEQTLREVRDRFEELEQKDLAEGVLSMLSDDNRLSYAGEDYEKIMIRAMLAVSNLMAGGDDAPAYALQVADKQNRIVQAGTDAAGNNPKLAYKRVALGAYLHAAMREETHTNYDDVLRCSALVAQWEPQFPFSQADLARAQHGRHSAPGNGVLYVLALVGRGPYKEEVAEVPTQVALLIADRILSATNKYSLPPTIAPVKVPKVVVQPNFVRGVQVSVDGRSGGQTATITDVGQLAVDQYAAIYPQVIARAVARRVVKKGIVYAGKDALEVNPWVSLAFDAAGVVWEATESADTRCWGLLPDSIQVLRLELPAGQHRLGLRPAGAHGPIGVEYATTVEIADGRNAYALATFPEDHLVGQIVVSR